MTGSGLTLSALHCGAVDFSVSPRTVRARVFPKNMSNSAKAIGIDFGGTTIKSAVVQDGAVLARGEIIDTAKHCTADAIIGELLRVIAAMRAAHPEIEWVQVERLGPDPLVAEALVERAAEAVGEGPGRAAEWTISPETT